MLALLRKLARRASIFAAHLAGCMLRLLGATSTIAAHQGPQHQKKNLRPSHHKHSIIQALSDP